MTTALKEPDAWLSVPEVAELLGLRQRDIRSMLKEKRLLAVPHGPNRALGIPVETIVAEGEDRGPLPALRGTLILLFDGGLDDEQAYRWLFTPDDELGSTPMTALRERRTHAVRRIAQTLAF
ncbi:MAG: Rv2175c family DNA-binding protein [Georgenia sp.]